MVYVSQTLPNLDILEDIQIIVVDNDCDNRHLHTIVLETYGARVTSLESIADSIAVLEYLIPDILICELRFFNEDILSLIHRVKSISLSYKRIIPILVISAYCSAGFSQNLLTMIEDYLLKPIDIDQLVDQVWSLVHLSKSTRQVNIQDWMAKHRAWTKQRTIDTMQAIVMPI